MTRRVILVAALVDLGLLILFLLLDSPVLAWLNLVSIAMYGVAYWLLTKRINLPAIALIWGEVLLHAAIGSLLVGWDSGFHYYLLMFIPAIVVSSRVRVSVFLVLILLAFYLGLHAVSRAVGIATPLSPVGLAIVHSFNVAVVFAMASYTARFYYGTVQRAEQKLVQFATQDSLTGLSNRRNFMALAKQEVARARRTGAPIALLIADIDLFKQINDQRGHDAGDRVIAHAASVMLQLCREQDIVARWGGEEFLLLLPATAGKPVAALAERIRQGHADTHVEHAGATIRYTLSLGVTLLELNEPISEAIARADRAMYQSKAAGRNKVTVAA